MSKIPPATPSETSPASSTNPPAPQAQIQNQTEVFAVHGADPEVLAYAMAKYSRSALSMRQSLRELNAQRAEQFLNTFYFQYGHRSIADLAHVAFAVERLSLLAAIVLVDEQRWDGQERSTRYQNFQKSGYYAPSFGDEAFADAAATQALYTTTIDNLFASYSKTSNAVFEALRARVGRPDGMKQDAYERTLKARAFDVARYLLPLATNTSLGQIVNARTLETQVSRLLSHPAAEIRDLGDKLRQAATGPAWNLYEDDNRALHQKIAELSPDLGEQSCQLLTRQVHASPTLVKYATPNAYAQQTQSELTQAAREIFGDVTIVNCPIVDLVERTETLEVELASTLLYSVSHLGYRQIRNVVSHLPEARITELIDVGLKHRGRHDELLRAFHAGAQLRFDILMDIGGFRDMHRHRRCTQIIQGFTTMHGYSTPHSGDAAGLLEAGLLEEYYLQVRAAHQASRKMAVSNIPEAAQSAHYVLPLATNIRSLFKMDFAEALYISELRSGPAGHFSYRQVAWEMYLAVQRQHPVLARYFRVPDYNEPIDLFKR